MTIQSILSMGGQSLSKELFNLELPISVSAFVQRRYHIKVSAFQTLFHDFTKTILPKSPCPILAVDGSDINIPTNPCDKASYFPSKEGRKAYSLLHLNALYNLDYHIYCDTTIQKRRDLDERQALIEMMTASPFKQALIIADRGYESYNVMAHCQEKGWLFLIRIRDGKNSLKTSFDLPGQACFDINFSLNLTRRQTKETLNAFKDRNHYKFIPNNQNFDFLDKTWDRKSTPQWYHLDFRIVRLAVEPGLYETSVTNCDYPVDKLKSLYTRRWGIETSFRSLKYSLGMISFHAKKWKVSFKKFTLILHFLIFPTPSSQQLKSEKQRVSIFIKPTLLILVMLVVSISLEEYLPINW